jgi:spectinomycin phosphotransferase
VRERLNISDEYLQACLKDQYALSVVSLEFLPLGLDSMAGVYRVVSAQGITYFLKVKSGSFYESACLVPRFLRDQGIGAVAAPLPTRGNALWAEMGAWTLTLYPYIEGTPAGIQI